MKKLLMLIALVSGFSTLAPNPSQAQRYHGHRYKDGWHGGAYYNISPPVVSYRRVAPRPQPIEANIVYIGNQQYYYYHDCDCYEPVRYVEVYQPPVITPGATIGYGRW